jgi:hypothetical protein
MDGSDRSWRREGKFRCPQCRTWRRHCRRLTRVGNRVSLYTVWKGVDINRTRSSMQTHLRRLGRQKWIQDVLRLGKTAAPLPASANSLELNILAIQGTTVQKKSMGRERKRWRAHQYKEGGRGLTDKPRRRPTVKPRVAVMAKA